MSRRIRPNQKSKRKHTQQTTQHDGGHSLQSTVDPIKLPGILSSMQITEFGDIKIFCPAVIIQAIAKHSAPIGIEIGRLNKFIFIDCDEVSLEDLSDLY